MNSIRTNRAERIIYGGTITAVTLVTLIHMFWRFTYPDNQYLSFFADDFYYYLEVAKNFHLKNLLSFDGIHLTNGYHPLWLLLLIGLLKLCRTTNQLYFITLSALISSINLLIFYFTVKVCSPYFKSKAWSGIIGLATGIFSIQIGRSGMEVILTILFMIILTLYLQENELFLRENRKIILTGFLCSLLVLSRIDSALWVLLFMVYIIDRKSIGETIKNVLSFGMGGILVPLYLLSNKLIFETWLPISGQIKCMKKGFMPNFDLFIALVSIKPQRIIILPTLMLSLYCCACIIKNKLYAEKKLVPHVINIAFVFAYFVILSFSTNWNLWSWYLYPFAALIPSTAIIIKRVSRSNRYDKMKNTIPAILAALFIAYGFATSIRYYRNLPPSNNSIFNTAKRIAEFEKIHEGIYAMGDRAGTPAFMMESPLIQLEGLVMDKKYQKNIIKQKNLIEVLKEYKVDYYLATNPVMQKGYYLVEEPANAGETSPKMKAKIQEKPVIEFNTPDGNKTVIFKFDEKS